mgnify:FL=1
MPASNLNQAVTVILGIAVIYIVWNIMQYNSNKCNGFIARRGYNYAGGGLGKLTPAVANLRFGGGPPSHSRLNKWSLAGSFGFPYYGWLYPTSYYAPQSDSVFTDVGVPRELMQYDQYLNEDRSRVKPDAMLYSNDKGF